MHLPGAERAVVDLDKLRHYCLNPQHLRGRHKARVFASALQVFQTDADWLREVLLDAVLRCDAMASGSDQFGSRYIVDFECRDRERTATIRSGCIARKGEDFPCLTTCYVLSG